MGRPGSYHVTLGLCGPICGHPVGGRGWLRGVGLNVPSSVDKATREHRTTQETSGSKAENADNTLNFHPWGVPHSVMPPDPEPLRKHLCSPSYMVSLQSRRLLSLKTPGAPDPSLPPAVTRPPPLSSPILISSSLLAAWPPSPASRAQTPCLAFQLPTACPQPSSPGSNPDLIARRIPSVIP